MHSGNILFALLACATFALGSSSAPEKLEADGFKLLGPSIGKSSRIQMNLWLSNSNTLLAFIPAFQYCKNVEGKLLSLENHEQRDYVNSVLMSEDFPIVWTSGIFNPSTTWTWLSLNKPMTIPLWFNAAPVAPTASDCLYFESGFFQSGLKSYACKTPFQFICEVPV